MGPGASRRQIARELTTAYAGGLLSEDTYVHRVEALRNRLIDPLRLIGDLGARSRAAGQTIRLTRAVSVAARRLLGGVDERPILLPLDWEGGERELLVGRHPECDVVVSDPSVSRRHARLLFRDGRWILLDLASTNGTTINGERVVRSELAPGDLVRLGNEPLKID